MSKRPEDFSTEVRQQRVAQAEAEARIALIPKSAPTFASWTLGQWLLGILVALAAVSCVYLIASGADKQSTGSGGTEDSFSAERACNNFVQDRLKSPSTAHFNADTSTKSGDTWTVSGSVDSENGFGANLRSTFTCTMTVSGNNVHLDNLDFNDGGDVN